MGSTSFLSFPTASVLNDVFEYELMFVANLYAFLLFQIVKRRPFLEASPHLDNMFCPSVAIFVCPPLYDHTKKNLQKIRSNFKLKKHCATEIHKSAFQDTSLYTLIIFRFLGLVWFYRVVRFIEYKLYSHF